MGPLLPSDPSEIGGYRLVARLGMGAMGWVYLAWSDTAELVALKVVKPDLLEGEEIRRRFADEIDSLRFVQGSRIARFEDAGARDNPPWLASEYVPGRTLRQHVEHEGPLEAGLAAALGVMLTDALEKIHKQNLFHRDLKPQNIMLGPDGPKVIDFGLAVLDGQAGQNTATGSIVGTPAYLPPEQATGSRAITAAADVYALGATLVYTATGHALYPSRSTTALIAAIVDPATPPDLSGVPVELVDTLASMVALDPTRRPSVLDVRRRLVAVVQAAGSMGEVRRRLVARTYVEPSDPPMLTEPSARPAGGSALAAAEDDDAPRGALGEDVEPAPAATAGGGGAATADTQDAESSGAESSGAGGHLGAPLGGRDGPRGPSAEPADTRFDPEVTVLIEPPKLPPVAMPAPAPAGGGPTPVAAGTVPPRARGPRPVSVGWLADELRTAYARDAPL
ncbi:serine/threonine-protein kinase [Pseudofrankia sp. BMG5.36]|uniref:serine/threonine-protein kinase n=1 Tax=Pseudofrankia sp. BMG5.36 TaxID=1834512 RepID=UPI0008DADF8E|nr:serine/threonine-protein kinase [Pseudofrankia sp. BMG5.36]OHV62895.1 hypothetical protein BCD48_38830 [Pseudofrankia sp. BMG5.36]